MPDPRHEAEDRAGWPPQRSRFSCLNITLCIIPTIVIIATVVAGILGNRARDSGGGEDTPVAPAAPSNPVCNPSEGDLTLTTFPAGGLFAFAGGKWHSFCAISVVYTAAEVACHQLGYAKAVRVFAINKSPLPTMPVDDVQCAGTEAALLDCRQHKLNKEKPLCDLDVSQAIECKGGAPTMIALNCSQAVVGLS